MRVLQRTKCQSFLTKGAFLTVMMVGGAMGALLPLHAQELQLNLPNLNLPRPIDEQQNTDELSSVEQNQQNKEDDINNSVMQKTLDTNSSSIGKQDIDAKENEQEKIKAPSASLLKEDDKALNNGALNKAAEGEAETQDNIQENISENINKNAQVDTQEQVKQNAQENVKEYTPALLQDFLQTTPVKPDTTKPNNLQNQHANEIPSQNNGQSEVDAKTTSLPETTKTSLNEHEQVNKNEQEDVKKNSSIEPSQDFLQQAPIKTDATKPHNLQNQPVNETPSQDNLHPLVDKKTALSPEHVEVPRNEITQEDNQSISRDSNQINTKDLLEDPQDVANNPVVAVIDAIVRERDPALKIDAARSDIFRFVSVERKGSTLLYKAAAPSLVTSPEWDGMTMTTIMCKEKKLRPFILDGKAAIKIEMNVVNPAGNYTFLADAHSCKQLTPEGESVSETIEEPDIVALALEAEAKRLSLFGCLKNSSTEMLENCTLGMVPRTNWEWQLQDVKTEQRKVMMTYLNKNEVLDEEEIRRVINRTCAKEEIHSIIQLGVVYDITVSGKANKEFLIDKQACDQL